jgi:hypothetical protein
LSTEQDDAPKDIISLMKGYEKKSVEEIIALVKSEDNLDVGADELENMLDNLDVGALSTEQITLHGRDDAINESKEKKYQLQLKIKAASMEAFKKVEKSDGGPLAQKLTIYFEEKAIKEAIKEAGQEGHEENYDDYVEIVTRELRLLLGKSLVTIPHAHPKSRRKSSQEQTQRLKSKSMPPALESSSVKGDDKHLELLPFPGASRQRAKADDKLEGKVKEYLESKIDMTINAGIEAVGGINVHKRCTIVKERLEADGIRYKFDDEAQEELKKKVQKKLRKRLAERSRPRLNKQDSVFAKIEGIF